MNILQIYKPISKLLSVLLLGMFFVSCENDQSPGVEYMPDMYRSPAIEPFVDYVFVDSMTSRLPPEHSIPKGYLPYPYENTLEGYEKAGKELKIPFPVTEKVLQDGEVLYSHFCAHCHGEKGDGKGTIKNPIYSAVPSYSGTTKNRRGGRSMSELEAGHIYHTIMYGLNAMGPHATLIREMDRWKIVAYVQTLQGKDVLENAEMADKSSESVGEEKDSVSTGSVDEADSGIEGREQSAVGDAVADTTASN